MDPDFDGDAFFNEESLPHINDGALQTQIDQLDPTAVGLGVPDAVALPTINADVLQRLVSLHANGCSNRLAWSRQGHIASISGDGRGIVLQYLVFDRRKQSWQLSPKRIEHVGRGQIANIIWSPLATDLAVLGVAGNLTVLRPVGTATNRLAEVKLGAGGDLADFGQVIGLHWLGQDRAERPRQLVQSASKSNDTGRWQHRHVKAAVLQPVYPRAIIVVSREAKLALIYEKMDSSFGKLTCDLVTHLEEYTHAAVAPATNGKLLVALHSKTGNISVRSVAIDMMPVRSEGLPTLKVELSASELSNAALPSLNGQIYDGNTQHLTHLGIIPSSEIEKATRLPTTVFGIYAHMNYDIAAGMGPFMSTATIRRWSISPLNETLFSKFNDGPTKTKHGATAATEESNVVEALPDKDEQAITNVSVLENGQGFHITTVDGRTDLLSTADLSSSLAFPSEDGSISSLMQAGFALPVIQSPASVALSPNLFCAAGVDTHQDVELAISQHNPPDPTQTLDPSTTSGDTAVA
ncbi:Mediator of RNA polymerase II transcription subunit 16 [Cyphellophora attinorum]|uniref:Mediator of RNA polymerase II transcription subunit 16 n=1 Tax=Cyphellophora attinorum TaxID=1664694 RepID=A0A0N1P1S8_9EURO|nr:Mediator of RNA polymerase II transcription subunit 16 [Phialophora attinorum]KPI44057.1 Mediator of RNA polymerase II transcription subunit 16 [Phialophora attinorum]